MRNCVQPAGDILTFPALVPVASGGVVVVGRIVGIASADALPGNLVDCVVTGVYRLPKVAADVVAVGDPLFFDLTSRLVTTEIIDGSWPAATASTGVAIGVATEASGNGAATATVRLSGF